MLWVKSQVDELERPWPLDSRAELALLSGNMNITDKSLNDLERAHKCGAVECDCNCLNIKMNIKQRGDKYYLTHQAAHESLLHHIKCPHYGISKRVNSSEAMNSLSDKQIIDVILSAQVFTVAFGSAPAERQSPVYGIKGQAAVRRQLAQLAPPFKNRVFIGWRERHLARLKNETTVWIDFSTKLTEDSNIYGLVGCGGPYMIVCVLRDKIEVVKYAYPIAMMSLPIVVSSAGQRKSIQLILQHIKPNQRILSEIHPLLRKNNIIGYAVAEKGKRTIKVLQVSANAKGYSSSIAKIDAETVRMTHEELVAQINEVLKFEAT